MKKYIIFVLVILLNFIPIKAIAQVEEGLFVYKAGPELSAYPRSCVDSITHSTIDGEMSQLIWTKDSVYVHNLGAIDSISFSRPQNIIFRMPEYDLNGWDFGYILGNEYIVGKKDESSNYVLMINKNGGDIHKGLVLTFDNEGNLSSLGGVDKIYDADVEDGKILLHTFNDEGKIEEFEIPYLKEKKTSRSSTNIIEGIQKVGDIISKVKDVNAINQDLLNWDFTQLLEDGAGAGIGYFTGKVSGRAGLVLTVGQLYVDFYTKQNQERQRKALYNLCSISIDEIKKEGGQCVVYTTVTNANTLMDYLVSMYEPVANEKTRNSVYCGITARYNHEYVTYHLHDFVSQEVLLNGDGNRLGSTAYFSFTIPNIDLSSSHSTIYFRPFLKSTRLAGKHSDIKEGYIKYGETIPYKCFTGEIKEYDQYSNDVSADNNDINFVMFRTSIKATINSIENVEEWGVYVYNLNNSGVYDYYPSEYKNAKLEDWIDIDFNINQNEFDEINNKYFSARKEIKIGVYKKIKNPAGTFDYDSYFYSEPEKHYLIYKEKPNVSTGGSSDIKETSATIECNYKNFLFWKGLCGVELLGNGKTSSIIGDFQIEGLNKVRITDLEENTTYSYRGFIDISGERIYGETHQFTTKKKENGIWVDLGLPSGVKWASHNVGATEPEEYGSYFKWGSISPNSSGATTRPNISGNPKYDAATANWGDGARMPTRAECEELVRNCTSTWTRQKGIAGRLVIGPNGNSIFLPAGNPLIDYEDGYIGDDGCYWSSSAVIEDVGAYYINFNDLGIGVFEDFLYCKYNIRPVHD